MFKLKLKSELILNKKFSIELSGYNAKEVDEYLDKILADYLVFEDNYEILKMQTYNKNELIKYKEEIIDKLKLEILTLKSQLKKTEEISNESMKKDIEELKRKVSKI